MVRYILILVFACVIYKSHAQQHAQYTQFMFNKMYFNPAYAGSKKNLCLSGIYRKQWLGIERAPQTGTFNAHGSVFKSRIGLGLSVTYDQIGFTDKVDIETNYSYIIRFKDESFLSLGLRGSFSYMQIRWDQANPTQAFDNSIPGAITSKLLPNFGAGVFYQSKYWYAGFSVPHLFQNNLDFSVNPNVSVEPKLQQHYFLTGGLSFDIAKNVQIQPNLLFKYVVNAPFDMDINLSFVFFQKLLVGITYRLGDSVDALVQWRITRQLQIAFAYDFTVSKLQQYNAGSIEAMLEYCFMKKHEKVHNPRFF
ncbi:MAG: type IX secretion system membrane protein PorP/SprF [Saprospiraceae bacterium]|nr:type IX secretion system membrane protein PorP/SprF [Saprospiraceae bacterium]